MTGGRVLSPVSGKITALFPTGHAIGIKSQDRNEYLLHLGLDTVHFHGQGFHIAVTAEQQVKQGDLLAEVDLEFFRQQGISMVSPILVVNANSRRIRLLKEGTVQLQENGFLAITP